MESKLLERSSPGASLASPDSPPLVHIDEGRALAQAIVDTIREPLLVLDRDLSVVTANRSFLLTFRMSRHEVQGRRIYALDGGQWDIPELRSLLGKVAPQHTVMEAYEVERDFPAIGRRTMLLNARQVFYEENSHSTILLAFEDITERRGAERELKELLHQKEVLLQEIRHRVANSLQIIASILLMKARTVRSEETRSHLQEAHQRVLSVAAMQQQLGASETSATIDLAPYLSRLCETLAASMIGGRRPISLRVHADGGTVSSNHAVAIGLIVTELVINAIKHAFPSDRSDGAVIVAYDLAGQNWRLMVSDNGIGKQPGNAEKNSIGLGTTIIEALAKQIDARMEVLMDSHGTRVSITHSPFPLRLPAAA
jgi:two-component sensor histidine kinase